jgi:hypothetical protein
VSRQERIDVTSVHASTSPSAGERRRDAGPRGAERRPLPPRLTRHLGVRALTPLRHCGGARRRGAAGRVGGRTRPPGFLESAGLSFRIGSASGVKW